MNKSAVILILAGLVVLGSCKKHSGGGDAVPAVDSVVIYSPVSQKTEIETFRFDGGRIAVYTDYNIDTTANDTLREATVHDFSYNGNDSRPASVTIVDSSYSDGVASLYSRAVYNLIYDGQGRLAADTLATAVPEEFNWSFLYTGDSVYVYLHYSPTNVGLWDQFLVSGGNLNGYRRESVESRGPANPLYDPSIGSGCWPYFLTSPPLFTIPVGFNILPVDFVSLRLPLQVSDPEDNAQLSFSWETDSSGRVVSGQVTGYQSQPVQIQFKYSSP